MAHITGPSTGHARLKGTSRDDVIAAYGNANTITGGGGNDIISANSGNNNSITIGTVLSDGLTNLTDIIHINGIHDTVSASDENIKLSGNASNSLVTLGRGSDTVSLVGASNMLSFGTGNDLIKVLGGNNSIMLTGTVYPTFSDSVTVSGADNTVINVINGGPYSALGTLNIQGGSGYGTFLAGTTGGTISTGGVGNYIEGGFSPTKIVAGSGYDTVNLVSGPRGTGGQAAILLAGTHNVVTGTTSDVTITGSSGYDSIELSAAASASYFHVTDGGVHDTINLNTANGATIDGGSSFEAVSLISSVANVTFAGKGDTLRLSGAAINAGYPTTTVTDLSSGLNIYLEKDGQTPGYPSVSDLTINDFDPTGVINFLGERGGFTSAGQAFADLHSAGQNEYTLTLPDGSGTITFLNDSHLSEANFHIG